MPRLEIDEGTATISLKEWSATTTQWLFLQILLSRSIEWQT